MAAPDGTVWGNIVGGYGRIGIYTSLSNTDTKTTATVEIWFWSKYSVSDSNNALYYDNLAASGSATTQVATALAISTSVASGEGWSTSNQIKLKSYSYTYTRTKSAVKRYLYAVLNGIDRVGNSMLASATFTIPALPTYTVSYNANGGSGAPSSQTKQYGTAITLSSTKPTRTGYTFQGWSTANDSTVEYAAGASYTANATVTLYAVWKANTYTVKYNANGGSGAPSNQTKTYGVALTLSSTKPTRTKYTFLGWATSASATTATYAAGGKYTANAAVTLYAVWELAYVKPRVNDYTLSRCESDGTYADGGTYVHVSFSWECDQTVSEITLELEDVSGNVISATLEASGTSGTVSAIVGDGNLNAESTYTVRLTVRDVVDYTTIIGSLSGAKFAIDVKAGGTGVSFGKAAELDDVCDIAFKTRLLGGLLYVVLEPETDLDDVLTPNTYIGANVSYHQYLNCPMTSGTFTLEVDSAGEDGQIRQKLTRCYKADPTVYERYYYSGSWGDWLKIQPQVDSGWQTLTLGSEFALYSSSGANPVRYRKIGKYVEVRGIVTPVADIAGGTDMHTIATLPSGCCPSDPIYLICQGSGNHTWLLRIAADGALGFSRYRDGATTDTAAAGVWLPFQATFFID